MQIKSITFQEIYDFVIFSPPWAFNFEKLNFFAHHIPKGGTMRLKWFTGSRTIHAVIGKSLKNERKSRSILWLRFVITLIEKKMKMRVVRELWWFWRRWMNDYLSFYITCYVHSNRHLQSYELDCSQIIVFSRVDWSSYSHLMQVIYC